MTALSFAGCQAVIRIGCSFKSCFILRFFRQQCRSFPWLFPPAHASLSETPGSTPFGEMMSALSGYQQGTAGSHLKQYTAACGVLNFAQQYDSNQEEQLRSDLDEYLNAASAETIDILAEGCGNVDFAAREILSNGVDGVADILNDAGNPNQYDEYDPEKYEAVAGILKKPWRHIPDAILSLRHLPDTENGGLQICKRRCSFH